jgi:citrate synthase
VVKTAISQVYPDRILVRGYNLVDVAEARSFGDVVYLLLRGELPEGREGRLIEVMLSMMVEHSINAPSIHAARTVAACGSPVQTAVAAGVSAIGDYHGGAGEACARILQEALAAAPPDADLDALAAQIVDEARQAGRRLPGFGHRFHNPDPRAVRLLALAQAWEIAGRHTALALALVDALAERTGRSLPLNIDGALAALISDMGFDWRLGKGFFIIARTAGLLAHVHEEMTTGKPFGFPPRAEVEYVGVGERTGEIEE